MVATTMNEPVDDLLLARGVAARMARDTGRRYGLDDMIAELDIDPEGDTDD
jgi:hypothetical protein